MKQYRTLTEIQTDLHAGDLTCVELVRAYLDQIQEKSDIGAFIEVFGQEALDQAAAIDVKISNGHAGKLAGMIIGIKDLLCFESHKMSASSRMLEDFESQFTGTALQRLIDEDVIVIGRQSCDEFAMGSSNENACYGPVKNPLNTDYVPGGSSGGSAAAVAAGMCHASLASDTGGSVRQPAGFCGLVGLKPTYGRISRWGLIAYASSLDQIGPLTHSVEDAALMFEVMGGHDAKDNTTSTQPMPDVVAQMESLASLNEPVKVGYIKEVFDSPGLDTELKAYLIELFERLKEQGHELVELEFPFLPYVVPCYYILTTAESSSNLSRYDGIRYGYRAEDSKGLVDLYKKTRTEGFGAEVKRRIMLGTFVLSAGYYDAYYTKAMKVRKLIQAHTEKLFEQCDFILMPGSPGTAFKIGEKSEDPIEMYLSDIFTVHANLAGVPAISLPLKYHSNGLPFGIQLLAPHFEEVPMLAFAKRLMEQETID